jgi:hypothetical protein
MNKVFILFLAKLSKFLLQAIIDQNIIWVVVAMSNQGINSGESGVNAKDISLWKA